MLEFFSRHLVITTMITYFLKYVTLLEKESCGIWLFWVKVPASHLCSPPPLPSPPISSLLPYSPWVFPQTSAHYLSLGNCSFLFSRFPGGWRGGVRFWAYSNSSPTGWWLVVVWGEAWSVIGDACDKGLLGLCAPHRKEKLQLGQRSQHSWGRRSVKILCWLWLLDIWRLGEENILGAWLCIWRTLHSISKAVSLHAWL